MKPSFGSIFFILFIVISQTKLSIQILILAWITNYVVSNKTGMDSDQQNCLNSPCVIAFEPPGHRLVKTTRYCRIIHMLFLSRIHDTVHWHFWSFQSEWKLREQKCQDTGPVPRACRFDQREDCMVNVCWSFRVISSLYQVQ